MRKDQLIKALVRRAKAARPATTTAPNKKIVAARAASKTAAAGSLVKPVARAGRSAHSRRSQQTAVEAACNEHRRPRQAKQHDAGPRSRERIRDAQARLAREKNLASQPRTEPSSRAALRDRAVLMARGPHWLHAFWEITPRSIDRVQAALGEEWHAAQAGTPTARSGQCRSWLSIGTRGSRDRNPWRGQKLVHRHSRSTPLPNRELATEHVTVSFIHSAEATLSTFPSGSQGDTLDTHWGDIAANCDKIYAMSGGFSPENHPEELRELFEERLKRPLGLPEPQRSQLEGSVGCYR
jgi:hypothetical protein